MGSGIAMTPDRVDSIDVLLSKSFVSEENRTGRVAPIVAVESRIEELGPVTGAGGAGGGGGVTN